MKLSRTVLGAFAVLSPMALLADPYTPVALPTQVQTHIRVDVKEDTKQINFINTNNDPWIFTKVYELKNADPYEMRPYVRSAVQAYRVTPANPNHIDNGTPSSVAGPGAAKVEAIKYMDGKGYLIVSAELYRFGKQPNGAMGIDELVEKLDQPDMTSSSGHKNYLYFPKYLDAVSLRNIMLNVGTSMNSNDQYELDQGKDRFRADPDLNAIFFYTPAYSVKTVEEMLKLYDMPIPEAKIKYTIYELSYENDGEIGVDFQAWKNGPGADLFSVGGRWNNGWDVSNMQPATRGYTGTGNTEFINFSPKWNTKYLDFLVSKSKANVITSGTLSVSTNNEGAVTSTTRIPSIQDGAQISSSLSIGQYIRLTDAKWDNGTSLPVSLADPYSNAQYNRYRIDGALDDKGNIITIVDPSTLGKANETFDFLITKSIVNSETYYYMKIQSSANAVFYRACDNTILGKEVTKAYNVKLQRANSVTAIGGGSTLATLNWADVTSWATDNSYTIAKDVQRASAINSYGFTLTVKPIVCGKASTVDVFMTNTNLVGFKSTGLPRLSKSEVSTKISLNNSGKQYVIGGLEKEQVVRDANKVPYLGDIPGLGWLLGSEGEISKKTKIVAVLETAPVTPKQSLNAADASVIKDVKDTIANYGTKAGFIDQNDYGYDQFLFDTQKDSFEPLP